MALVRVGRFNDLQETQIAAGMLRAQGYSIFLQNELMGANDYLLREALGGFNLFAPEEEAEAIKATLKEALARAPEPDPDAKPDPPPNGLATVMLFVGAALLPVVVWPIALIIRRRQRSGLSQGNGVLVGVVAVVLILILGLVVFTLLPGDS